MQYWTNYINYKLLQYTFVDVDLEIVSSLGAVGMTRLNGSPVSTSSSSSWSVLPAVFLASSSSLSLLKQFQEDKRWLHIYLHYFIYLGEFDPRFDPPAGAS